MQDSLKRQFWRFLVPTVAAMMVSGLYQFVDGLFVGQQIGAVGLAAINIAWPVIGLVYGVALMVGIGAGALSSMARGDGDGARVARWLGSGITLLLLMAVGCGVLLQVLGEWLLTLQQARGEVLAMARTYLQVLAWGCPLALGGIAIPFLVRNDNAPNLSTLLIGGGALANIALDYLFIVQLDWQLQGAALATVLSQALVLLLGLGYFRSSLCRTRLALADMGLTLADARAILALGMASWLMYLYYSFITAVHNAMLLEYGDAIQVGAFSIVGYLCVVYYLFAEGVAGGAQPLLSYLFGAREYPSLQRVMGWALGLVLISGLLTVLLFFGVPTPLIHAFNSDDTALFEATRQGLAWHTWALYFDGIIFVIAAYFQSVGDGRRAGLITLANLALQLPFLLLLPIWLGVQGVWISVPLSNTLLVIWVLRLLWQDWQRRGLPLRFWR
ncbi:MATE family efflux transporter [Ferrimonas sediminicola]|uniref:Multidrug export protein MepA n=1 Tax=Ferrimonas sediminicola TaxID=2569538 RepID=A0A4U1BG39_9GAMM|nr:MATE family efflux transporter [Ferrimonas sediminicola]TKB49390.1 MATE family efflux transporter [Ferrimonas sediminicola]